MIIGSAVGAAVLLLATIISCYFMHKGRRRYNEQGRGSESKRHILLLSEIWDGRI